MSHVYKVISHFLLNKTHFVTGSSNITSSENLAEKQPFSVEKTIDLLILLVSSNSLFSQEASLSQKWASGTDGLRHISGMVQSLDPLLFRYSVIPLIRSALWPFLAPIIRYLTNLLKWLFFQVWLWFDFHAKNKTENMFLIMEKNWPAVMFQ